VTRPPRLWSVSCRNARPSIDATKGAVAWIGCRHDCERIGYAQVSMGLGSRSGFDRRERSPAQFASSPLPCNCQQTANVNSNGRVARGHLAHTQCPEVRQESSKTDELSGRRTTDHVVTHGISRRNVIITISSPVGGWPWLLFLSHIHCRVARRSAAVHGAANVSRSSRF
jgi:hypothetical protein